jgi:hypothetical protein
MSIDCLFNTTNDWIHSNTQLTRAIVSEPHVDKLNFHVILSYRIRDRDEGFLMLQWAEGISDS